MGEVTREELAAMTEQEQLAYEREHHGDPYMALMKAKGMQRVALQFWHVGAAQKWRSERPRTRRRSPALCLHTRDRTARHVSPSEP